MSFWFILKLKLQNIQKLSAFFRSKYPDWHITLLANWRQEDNVFIREVVHEGGGKALAYAKVEVPAATFWRFHLELKNLKDQSIGDHFLFIKADVIREPFEFLEPQGEYPLIRRSRFKVEGLPLMITEYFTHEGVACFSA